MTAVYFRWAPKMKRCFSRKRAYQANECIKLGHHIIRECTQSSLESQINKYLLRYGIYLQLHNKNEALLFAKDSLPSLLYECIKLGHHITRESTQPNIGSQNNKYLLRYGIYRSSCITHPLSASLSQRGQLKNACI